MTRSRTSQQPSHRTRSSSRVPRLRRTLSRLGEVLGWDRPTQNSGSTSPSRRRRLFAEQLEDRNLLATWYVDDSMLGGANTGVDWTNAFTNLQSALSFNLKNDVSLYGGFAGTESNLSERNWVTNVTSADVDENSPEDTFVGVLTSTDPDLGEAASHTYELVDDADGRFKIVGAPLLVAAGADLNYEAHTYHDIDVRVTDTLGATRDVEDDGQSTAAARGDDDDAWGDDEDGVTLPATLIARLGARIAVTASAAGKLDAWIDFNRDNVFGATEQIATGLNVVTGLNQLLIDVPATAQAGLSYARFRLSSAGDLTPQDAASDGEVEDYQVQLAVPALGSAQVLPDPANPGQNVLLINGTNGPDAIVARVTAPGQVTVYRPSTVALGTFSLASFQRIVVFGLAGNDSISIEARIDKPATLYGDAGNDSLLGGRVDVAQRRGSGPEGRLERQLAGHQRVPRPREAGRRIRQRHSVVGERAVDPAGRSGRRRVASRFGPNRDDWRLRRGSADRRRASANIIAMMFSSRANRRLVTVTACSHWLAVTPSGLSTGGKSVDVPPAFSIRSRRAKASSNSNCSTNEISRKPLLRPSPPRTRPSSNQCSLFVFVQLLRSVHEGSGVQGLIWRRL